MYNLDLQFVHFLVSGAANSRREISGGGEVNSCPQDVFEASQ